MLLLPTLHIILPEFPNPLHSHLSISLPPHSIALSFTYLTTLSKKMLKIHKDITHPCLNPSLPQNIPHSTTEPHICFSSIIKTTHTPDQVSINSTFTWWGIGGERTDYTERGGGRTGSEEHGNGGSALACVEWIGRFNNGCNLGVVVPVVNPRL